MQHRLTGTIALIALLGTGLAAPVAAEEKTSETRAAPAAPAAPGATAPTTGSKQAVIPELGDRQLLARNLIGSEVRNAGGDTVGTVSDLILGEDGQIEGVVVSIGGFLGIGSKPVAVSREQADVTGAKDQRVVTVRLSEDELARAPEFKEQEQPAKPDRPAEVIPSAPPPSGSSSGSSGGSLR